MMNSIIKLGIFAILFLILFTGNTQDRVIHAQAVIATDGIVFIDFNNSGTYENTPGTYVESGAEGVTITAYAPDGTVAATALSDANGQYSLDIPDSLLGERIRVEFTTIPATLFPGQNDGSNNGAGTTLRYITVGTDTTDINLTLMSADAYCTAGPDLITSCYTSGDQTSGDATIVGFNYDIPHGSTGGYTSYLNLSSICAGKSPIYTLRFVTSLTCLPLPGGFS